MKADHFDLVVIGSGPAGEKGAAQAAYHGRKVAVVERVDGPGGATVRNAGIPTKTLRETALFVSGFRKKELYGVRVHLDPQKTFDQLRARTASVSAAMAEAVARNLQRHGIEFVRGAARLGPGRTVRVTGTEGERTLGADVILIATGSRPFRPPSISFDDPDVLDSETLLEVERPFGSAVIIGGGPVGCEYASVFAALGLEVTLVDAGERLLPMMDGEVSRLLERSFAAAGVEVRAQRSLRSVSREAGKLRVELDDGGALSPDKLLFAAGRVGNVHGLGLEEAGVKLDPRNRVIVDENYRTSVQGIYAAGDVIGPPALASVSMEQARVAICHAFDIRFKLAVDPVPPIAVYTMPEVAGVGMTEEAAQGAGLDYEVGRGWLAQNTRAVIAGDTEGLIKLVFDRQSLRLLGAHVISEEAAELVHQGQAVLNLGGHVDYFIQTTFGVPTWAEAYKYAAYDGLTRVERRAAAARS